MIQEVLFTPELSTAEGYFVGRYGIPEFAAEVSPKSVGWDEAVRRAGPILREMLAFMPGSVAPPEGMVECIDVRTQRLTPGQYPAIPGWHCDHWPRAHPHAQPTPPTPDLQHPSWTALAGTGPGTPLTEFVAEPLLIPIDFDAGSVWAQVHRYVEEKRPATIQMPLGQVWRFGPFTIHRARPATARCWRQWIRLHWRQERPTIVESAEQVYVLSEECGW